MSLVFVLTLLTLRLLLFLVVFWFFQLSLVPKLD